MALLATLFSFICCSSLIAQTTKGELFFTDVNQQINCKISIAQFDTTRIENHFSKCLNQFIEQGYISARIDSIKVDAKTVIAFAYKGPQYVWVNFTPDSLSLAWLSYANIKVDKSFGKYVNPKSIAKASFDILKYFEDNGYPFASIKLENTAVDKNSISGSFRVEPGPLILTDTLYIKGDAKISYSFIKSYLGFSPGMHYSEKVLKNYDSKLKRLNFIEIIRPNEVEFTPGKVRVYSYLTNKPASQFNGLVGFASSSDENKVVQFTGDVNLRLINVFRRGEHNSLQWKALGDNSQRINMLTTWPYLFGSRIGAKAQFIMYRRDSTYIKLNPSLTADFYLLSGATISLGVDHRTSSTVLNVTSGSVGDFKTTLYQVSYTSIGNSNELFAVKDIGFSSTVGIGKRVVSLERDLVTTVVETKGMLYLYYPLFWNNLVFHIKLVGEYFDTVSAAEIDIPYFENELFQIGGSNSLRGFNQESIYTSAYAISSSEIQFRIQNTINLFLFFDKAIVNSSVLQRSINTWPYGIGAGFYLATQGGTFNLSYALGQGFGQNLNFRDAKIHVGYTARF